MTRTRHGVDTWLDVLGETARRRPGSSAFTFLGDGGETAHDLTYAELDRRARTIAAHLQHEGMAGRRVVLWYPSDLEFLAAFFGCLYAGAVAVPAYPPTRQRRSVERVLAIVEDATPSCALTTAAVRDRLPAETLIGGRPPIATDTLDPALAGTWSRPDVGPDTVAFLQYTSGSTARPRGVVLTHANLLANSAMIQETFGTSEHTRAVSWLPMYHDMGLIGSILHVLDHGGHTTLMSPVAFVQSPVRWLQAISRTRATASGAPNFAYDLCVDRVTPAERAALDLSSWELAFNGAEPIRPDTLERFARTFAPCGFRAEALTPCYGLAEATLIVSARRVGSGVVTHDDRVSCGVRPTGVRVEIVDPQTRTPCASGGTGEIWVAGPAVGQGYWNQAETTAETFRATLTGSSGPTFLRTGDLGYLRDGELYVTGRQKDLIIVRGRNHYPQDVERTVESLDPSLRRGGSAAFAVPVDAAEELVVLAEVGRRDVDGDLTTLARRVRGAVATEHDVRPHDVALIRPGALPKTSSGKVQRHAGREAYLNGDLDVLAHSDEPPAPARPAAVPAGSTARILLVADVLRAEIADLVGLRPDRVDLDEPLVMLGLDSMTALALQHRIVTRLGVELPLEDAVSQTGTEIVDALVHEMAGRPPAPAGPAGPPPAPEVVAQETDQELPANQAALWLQHQLVPDSPAHLLAMAVRIDGPVDAGALGGAVRTLADRHDALRTTFPVVDGVPVARVHPVLAPRFDVVDAAGWDEATLDAAIVRAAHDPLDISAGPLLRVTLFVRRSAEHRLVIAVDHLVADLWSLDVMVRELEVLCPAGGAGGALPAAGSYAAFAREQRDGMARSGDRLEAYWCERLAGAPTLLDLGTAAGPPRRRRMRAGAIPFTVDPAVAAGLTALAARLGVTRYAVLLGAYQTLLAQWSGQQDVLVGSPAHGRGRATHSGTVGLFVNMMALRGRPTPERTVAQLVAEAHDGVRGALAHSGLPFAHLVERLRPQRHPARSPLVQAVLTWQRTVGGWGDMISALALNRPGAAATIGGMAAETLELPPEGTQFDLVLTVADIDGGLSGRLQYDPDLIDAATARRAVDQLALLLAAFVTAPQARLDSLPELAPAAGGGTVEDAVWDGGPPAREARCVHVLFAEQVAARPDATAVVLDGETLSYRELDARADALAHRLRGAGAGRGDLVALFLERSIEFVMAAVAVLKAGAAYLPLDPAHPAGRRRYVLTDAGPRYAVVRGRTLDHEGVTVIDLAGPVEQETGPGTDTGPLPAGDLDRLAYVIYTSGSSGQPKGVPISHRGVANLFAATADFGFDHDDVWMLFHSAAFDFSVWEMWGCLVHGGMLVVVPPAATLSAEAFWDLLRQHGVTVLNQTPAVFREMTVTCPERLAGLAVRHVILGGEKLEPEHLAAWREHGVPSARLTNMYGLTESSVVATRGPVEAGTTDGVIPLGAPLAGTQLCLLDADGDPVRAGEGGEICLSGGHLTSGYVGRPALTASRFTPHPLLPGHRMYRTGDLARRRPDGSLAYLGRTDEQVQIRGHRVEPGEIVAELVTHPAVRDAVVLADTAPSGVHRLVAYVVPDGDGAPSAAGLRAHLRHRLPEYMVPGRFVPVGTIPVTGSGKVDRRALPCAAHAAGVAEPATSTERQVAQLVGEMVALPRVGRDDDLFDLGWHSLLMARLASRIRDEFAVVLPLQDLFAEPTVERISALIDAGTPDVAVPPSVPAISRVDRSRYQVAAGASGLPDAMRS